MIVQRTTLGVLTRASATNEELWVQGGSESNECEELDSGMLRKRRSSECKCVAVRWQRSSAATIRREADVERQKEGRAAVADSAGKCFAASRGCLFSDNKVTL